VERLNQRQGFLVSAIVHLSLLMIVLRFAHETPRTAPVPAPQAEPRPERLYLPPRAFLQRVMPLPPRPAAPRPKAEPPRPDAKDKISIGPPSAERSKEPLVLRKEDDLTAVPKGQPSTAPATPPPVEPSDVARREAGQPALPGSEGLRLPPQSGTLARGNEGSQAKPGAAGERSITSSLRNLEQKLAQAGPAGLPTGTGRQIGPLFFDPEGADFTVWMNHFKNEVYRNWIVPQPALLGMRGHIDIEFTVERDGSMTNVRVLKPTGMPALDRAAQNALSASRFLPLPSDYRPIRVTMQVTFFYNEGPQGS
jgi:TonB family protein